MSGHDKTMNKSTWGHLGCLQILNVWILSFYNDGIHTAFWLEPIVKECEYPNKDNILITSVFLYYFK